ncbi:MAG: hypothetical protein OXB86_04085 [Bdellovibrionales bacterium]|nr:hypothetical protein [Bdellovibrionales bacterium]
MKGYLKDDLRPFISILIVIIALFIAAFSKITLRRISYSLYKESEKFNRIQDNYYKSLTEYAGMNHIDRLERQARRHSLVKTKKGQIIQVIDGKAIVVD